MARLRTESLAGAGESVFGEVLQVPCCGGMHVEEFPHEAFSTTEERRQQETVGVIEPENVKAFNRRLAKTMAIQAERRQE